MFLVLNYCFPGLAGKTTSDVHSGRAKTLMDVPDRWIQTSWRHKLPKAVRASCSFGHPYAVHLHTDPDIVR